MESLKTNSVTKSDSVDFYGRNGPPMSIDEYNKRFGPFKIKLFPVREVDENGQELQLGSTVSLGNASIATGTFIEHSALEKLRSEAYQLCLAIERLPAGKEATDLSVQASAIHQKLQNLV